MDNNQLYPVFLRLDKLNVLIVGGGAVAYEKLSFLLKSSPNANVTLVSREISEDVWRILQTTDSKIEVRLRAFEANDLDNIQILIAATNDRATNHEIRQLAKAKNILVNVADTPDLCDFYLGSIVTKGPLKIGISTNGQSPVLAKRIRQFLETALPDDIEKLIHHLALYRESLAGDFHEKVKTLNELTSSLINNQPSQN